MSEKSAKMFQAVFENSPVGLVLVNKDTSLRDVNNYMFKTFKLASKAVEGQRFGNVFNCAAISGKNEICGTFEACSQCGLRGGVSAVLEEGSTISNIVMNHDFIINGSSQKKWFKISASRIVSEGDTFAIVSFADITTEKEYEELLNNQLSLDLATGTTNKHALLNILKRMVEAKKDLTVSLLDFDDFKSINDSWGHVVGDKVIRLFCAVASESIRKQDIVGRFGGEEFMLVFPGASSDLLVKVLQRISESFRKVCRRELGITPTFSAGIAQFSSEQMAGMDVDTIIAEADSNLYLSKSRGKNMITAGGVSIPLKE